MTSPQQGYDTDYRTVTIKTTDGSTVQGRVNIAPNQRVSELFNLHKGPFVVVVEATYSDVRGKTLFINKDHIVWVEPEFEPTD
jgi:small nuclear ribonucleoprotein (snRNP)-like protein